MILDLIFPVAGERVPVPHGYPLYAGLSRVLPALHDGSVDFGLGAITGQYVGRLKCKVTRGLARSPNRSKLT